MSAVLEAIRGLGVDEGEIRTQRVDLHPRYAHPESEPRAQAQPQQPRITGYVATNQVLVTLDDVGMVGRMIDAGIAAGANHVSGIQFRLSDPESVHREALRLAIEKARREAQAIAEALDETAGRHHERLRHPAAPALRRPRRGLRRRGDADPGRAGRADRAGECEYHLPHRSLTRKPRAPPPPISAARDEPNPARSAANGASALLVDPTHHPIAHRHARDLLRKGLTG